MHHVWSLGGRCICINAAPIERWQAEPPQKESATMGMQNSEHETISPMKYGLQIREAGGLDFLSLGALVHRLDPGIIPFRKATKCDIHVSGGEFNVAANLADCFRLNTGIATAMVDYPVGDLIAERVRAMGVKSFYKQFKHDGVHGPNMATVYSDRGQGVRAPVVFYNRCNEAAAQLKPGDFDWKNIFAQGVRWFHSGGIFAALSPTTAEVIVEGMKAAKAAGAIVSFDLNYRAKLWNILGGHDRAVAVLDKIVRNVDVLVGNEEDLQMGLGIPGPEVAAKSKLDPSAFFGMIGNVTKKHPQIKIVATTLREVHSTNRHSWSAVAWINGQTFNAPTCELDVLDRVGGGDGFAAGLIYGLLHGEPEQEAVKLGWAHGALLTTFPGDTTMATIEQVKAFAKGGSARIQR
jgi:2-dehydro-3-deoxygluconokinase